jgi:CubicO group peptidase (beta-lactamase class C family)
MVTPHSPESDISFLYCADMPIVFGECDPAFECVRAALGRLIDSGRDVGASAAVVHEGRVVAEVWGGHLDETRSVPWSSDTIVCIWSTTKTMCNLAALVLASAGEIDLDSPVAEYWPEFRAAGKDGVLVRHVLGHTAGLPSWRTRITAEDLYDWEKATALLADDEPWWEPGTAAGYHALSQGFLVGEVVRRVTGQSLGTWFAQNLAVPLGADVTIGTSAAFDERVAPIIPPVDESGSRPEPGSIRARALANPPLPASVALTVPWRRAEIPAGNGFGNARGVALVQSIVSGEGEAGGRRFLSPAMCARIFEEQANGPDLVIGMPVRYGIGYGLPTSNDSYPSARTCYWGGRGGSLVVNDLDNHLTVAYVMNRMQGGTTGDDRAASIVGAAYEGLAAVG